MGIDLTLLPFRVYDSRPQDAHASDVLHLNRSSDLWDEIRVLTQEPVPRSFDTYLCRDGAYEEPHYGDTQEDAYGEPLMSVPVGALAALEDCHGVRDWENGPAWAYLAALAHEGEVRKKWYTYRVALYWH